MAEKSESQRSEADKELERELLRDRKFTLAEAIGRLAGPGALKGVSPVSQLQQAGVVISEWLRGQLADSVGALRTVLHRRVEASELLLNNVDQPLVVLAATLRQILESKYQLQELVREADVEWGRIMEERPYFEQEGTPNHPADPYTVSSVRKSLEELLARF